MKIGNHSLDKMRIMLIACFCMISSVATTKAQSRELITNLKNASNDTTRIMALIDLSNYYVESEWNYNNKIKVDSALRFLKEAKVLSSMGGRDKYLHSTYKALGRYYFRADDVSTASQMYFSAILICQRTLGMRCQALTWYEFGWRTPLIPVYYDSVIARMTHAAKISAAMSALSLQNDSEQYIANVHVLLGKFAEAESEYEQLVKLQESILNYKGVLSLYNLSKLNIKIGNYSKALDYGLKAIQYSESFQSHENIHVYLSNVASIYHSLDEFDKSHEFHAQAMEYLDKQASDGHWMNMLRYDHLKPFLNSLLTLKRYDEAMTFLSSFKKRHPPKSDFSRIYLASVSGDVLLSLKQYGKAEEQYKLASRIASKTGQINEIKEQYFLLLKLYTAIGAYSQATAAIDSFSKYPQGVYDALQLSEVHHLRFKIDSAQGKYLSAMKEYQLHRAISDSIFSSKKARQIEELQIQYQTQKNEREIELLQNRAMLQDADVARANLIKRVAFAGAAILLMLLLLTQRAYRLKKRANRLLELKQQSINQYNRKLKFLVKEKQWLVKEIHHRVKNNLHTILSLLESQASYLTDGGEKNAIRNSQNRIQAMSLLHQKLYQTKDMKSVDMRRYIEELVAYLKESFDAYERIQFNLEIDEITFDDRQSVTIALILNESITNALKYAFPNQRPGVITVELKQHTIEMHRLIIADNGVGLPSTVDLDKSRSLGFNLIKGLTQDLEGKMQISTDAGTHVKIWFPSHGSGVDATLEHLLKEDEN